MKAGGPGAPLSQGQTRLSLLKDRCPQPSPSVLSPCNNGSSRKWLNPLYFYTQHTLGRSDSRSFCVCGGGGRVRYTWGKGLNTKKVAPAHSSRTGSSPCQLQAEVTGLHFCRGAKLLANAVKNNSPAKLRSQRRVSPLWASPSAFSGPRSTGDAGYKTHPFPYLLKSGLSSDMCFGSPRMSLCPLPGADTFRTLYIRGANSTVSLSDPSQGLLVAAI